MSVWLRVSSGAGAIRIEIPAISHDALCKARAMAGLRRIAPILPVRDVDRALAHYQRLGFSVRAYDKGGYGFATRDGLEIHRGLASDDHATSSAYLFMDDADELAEAWRANGVEVHTPEDTEWGQHEG